MDQSGAAKKSVFNFALKAKQAANSYSIPILGGLTDTVVFNQVKQQTGGRLRYAFNGGGAVSRSTQQFLMTALVDMIQGGHGFPKRPCVI